MSHARRGCGIIPVSQAHRPLQPLPQLPQIASEPSIAIQSASAESQSDESPPLHPPPMVPPPVVAVVTPQVVAPASSSAAKRLSEWIRICPIGITLPRPLEAC